MTRSEARQLGLKRFFSGIPCVHGHLADRVTVTGNCVKCKNKAVAARLKRLAETSEEYREYHRKASLKYYYKNREKTALKNRQRYLKNKRRHAERGAAYYQQNKDRYRDYSKKRKAIKRGARTALIVRQRDIEALFKAQKGKCAYFSQCRTRLGKDYHRDHIVPLTKGGAHAISNLQLTCPTCNRQKAASDPIEFAKRLGMLV
jgi:5-methylcytosine-specific restriction endonuclease McrA